MLKLRIAPPGAGESLSSVVDRAAGLFNVARSNILRQLGCAGDPDLDIGSESVLGGLSRAMSLSIEDLADICLTHGREQQFVRRVERFAYCPLCMADDVQSGSVPWFRLDWSRLWMTHCACHGTPLRAWRTVSRVGQRLIPHAFYVRGTELPEWFTTDVAWAEAWRYTASEDPSYAMWRAIRNVEASWATAGVGSSRQHAGDTTRALEAHLARLAAGFMAVRRADKACLGELVAVPPEQDEVMYYGPRWPHVPTSLRNRRDVRARLADLPTRRLVIALMGWSFGKFNAPLFLCDGQCVPAYDDPEWIEMVSSFQNEPVVRRALRIARDGRPFTKR